MPLKRRFSPFLTNLDLALARTVNGATAGRRLNLYSGHLGAIAQLGERIVRNDEVGGSIPPGSTSLRRLRLLRLGKPHRSEGCLVEARRAKTGFIGSPPSLPRKPWRPLLHKARHAFPEIAAAQ